MMRTGVEGEADAGESDAGESAAAAGPASISAASAAEAMVCGRMVLLEESGPDKSAQSDAGGIALRFARLHDAAYWKS
jgi:hypothetical protein